MRNVSRLAPAKCGEFVLFEGDREYVFRGRPLEPQEFNDAWDRLNQQRHVLPYPISAKAVVDEAGDNEPSGDLSETVAELRTKVKGLLDENKELNAEVEHLVHQRAISVKAKKKPKKRNTAET